MLLGAGYVSITSTKDPHEVCELHRKKRYSLILLDLQMAGLDGFQVMEELKAIEADGYLPVLVQTAQPDHKLRALKAGAKDFVSKPFDLAEVLMRIHNMLEVRLLHLEAKTQTEQIYRLNETLEQRVVERTAQLQTTNQELQGEISERKRSEESLRLSEIRYRRLFETAQYGILILDADTGQVVDTNPFMTDLLGYSLEEFVGKKLWEIGPFKGIEDSKNAFAEMQGKDCVHLHHESLPLEARDGQCVEVEFTCNSYLVDLRRVIQCNIRDITARNNLERIAEEKTAELARSNAELGQFAYVASHDLQEPLRAVASCVQLLKKRYEGQLDERAHEFISHAVAGTARMETLIDDLLTYSRVGTQTQTFEPTNCGAVLKEALSNLRASLEESKATVIHDELPILNVDPTQLGQVFQNLVGNAIKFSGGRPPIIRITATLRDGEWTFIIADNGIGVEPQYFERIFRVFQRLHTRKQYHGTGIGLAICKKVIERHGGRIWIESVVGQGSTFYFTIPDQR